MCFAQARSGVVVCIISTSPLARMQSCSSTAIAREAEESKLPK